MENLKEQPDVLLWLNHEFDHCNMQYFNQYFSKHFRPSVSVNAYRKDLQKNKDYVTLPKTQPGGINNDVNFHTKSLAPS